MATPAWVRYARALRVRNRTIRLLKGERAVTRATLATIRRDEPKEPE